LQCKSLNFQQSYKFPDKSSQIVISVGFGNSNYVKNPQNVLNSLYRFRIGNGASPEPDLLNHSRHGGINIKNRGMMKNFFGNRTEVKEGKSSFRS
jgi:hypothetical protein